MKELDCNLNFEGTIYLGRLVALYYCVLLLLLFLHCVQSIPRTWQHTGEKNTERKNDQSHPVDPGIERGH